MRRPVRTGLALGIAAVVAVAGIRLVGGIGGFLGNPFRSERHERVDPAVLHALRDADELRAATAEMEVVVEVEDDTRYVPDVLSGQQTTFLAAGTVDATVDLGGARVEQAPDGTVTVVLPPPELDRVHVDSERSRVLDRDRGLFDRIGDAFTDDPDDDRDLYLLAEDQLRTAAGEGALLERAEANARRTVQELFADAGVGDVTVQFATPAAPAAR